MWSLARWDLTRDAVRHPRLATRGGTEPVRRESGADARRCFGAGQRPDSTDLLRGCRSYRGTGTGGPGQRHGDVRVIRAGVASDPDAVEIRAVTDSDGERCRRRGRRCTASTLRRLPACDGAAGDADGDGVSNAAEFRAGTHPRGTVVRYFAEGATRCSSTRGSHRQYGVDAIERAAPLPQDR